MAKKIDLSTFSEDDALQITGDTIERLLLRGINTMDLTNEDDEVIRVHWVNLGKPEVEEDLVAAVEDETVDTTE